MALDDRRSYFNDDSMLRRVIRETVVAFSTPRTLLMQAAHPVAFAGFFVHHLLPSRWRLPFFAALSLAATLFVLGVGPGSATRPGTPPGLITGHP